MRVTGQHLPAPGQRRLRPVRRPRATLPYLHDLGVDWVYLSPLLAAEPGSDHGYDVVDHDRVDPDRGGRRGPGRAVGRGRGGSAWACSSTSCPTTSASPTPAAERRGGGTCCSTGAASAHADAFDVDWDAGGGRSASRCSATTTTRAIELDGRRRRAALPRPPLPDRPRHGDGTPRGARPQHYELVDWRRGDAELNYRRFFAVNTLAGVRVEDPAVFDDSHVEIRRWFDEGLVDGLRVDHPDGLRDPGYLDDLRRADRRRLRPGREDPRARRGAAGGRGRPPAPPGTTRWRWSTGCSSTRPGEAPLDRARGRGCAAAPVDWRDAGPRHQARGRRRHPRRRGPPASSASVARPAGGDRRGRSSSRTPSPSCWPASRSTAPTCPTAASTSTRRSPRPARRRPDLARRSTRSRRCSATRTQPAALRFQQTSGDGDGQGRRGLRVLPLRRGSPRSTRSAATRASSSVAVDEFHARDGRAAARLAARDDDAVHPRHQAQRGRPGPDHRARRAPRRCGPTPSTGCSRWRRCPTRRSATCSGRPSSAPGRRRASGCTRTPRRRCARPATAPPGPTPTRPSRRPCTPPSTRRSTTRRCAAVLDGARRPDRRRRAGATRWPPSCSR